MKSIFKIILTNVILISFFSSAQAHNFAVSPKIGTLGAGVEASYQINSYFSLNTALNGFKLNKKLHKSDIHYNGHLRLLTLGLIANVHPFQNGFKLTGGAFYNLNRLDLSATPSRNVRVSGHTYSSQQLGRLSGNVEFNRLSPYFGLGYDSAFYGDNAWSMNVEVGVLYQGHAKVNIAANGLLKK
jgi:hypothetical protein